MAILSDDTLINRIQLGNYITDPASSTNPRMEIVRPSWAISKHAGDRAWKRWRRYLRWLAKPAFSGRFEFIDGQTFRIPVGLSRQPYDNWDGVEARKERIVGAITDMLLHDQRPSNRLEVSRWQQCETFYANSAVPPLSPEDMQRTMDEIKAAEDARPMICMNILDLTPEQVDALATRPRDPKLYFSDLVPLGKVYVIPPDPVWSSLRPPPQ